MEEPTSCGPLNIQLWGNSLCFPVSHAYFFVEVQWRSWGISPFTVTGAHAHWVGSTDTPSHATKELEMR